jgi:hypothetical protein
MSKIDFRSKDEEAFYHWCEDAQKKGDIISFEYEPKTYELIPRQTVLREKQLITKTKTIDKFLCHPLKYTPDFIIESAINYESKGLIYQEFKDDIYFYVIDVKGKFCQHHDGVKFPVIQKVFLYTKGIFCNKLIIDNWFKKTYPPSRRLLKDDIVYKNKSGIRKRFK